MQISHKDHNNTIQVYSVTVMTHVKALEAGQSSQGISEPFSPASLEMMLKPTTHHPLVVNSAQYELQPHVDSNIIYPPKAKVMPLNYNVILSVQI